MAIADRLHRPVLVLNASFEPINICAARRALVLILKGVASAEELAPSHVHSARRTMGVPSVIRLLEYRRIPHQTRALSRKNILMRDRYTCQYCHKTLPSGEMTLDHVVPRSRAGNHLEESGRPTVFSLNQQQGQWNADGGGGMKLPEACTPPFICTAIRGLIRRLAGNRRDNQSRKYLFFADHLADRGKMGLSAHTSDEVSRGTRLALALTILGVLLYAADPWSHSALKWNDRDVQRILYNSPWAHGTSANFDILEKLAAEADNTPPDIPIGGENAGLPGSPHSWDGGVGRPHSGPPALPVNHSLGKRPSCARGPSAVSNRMGTPPRCSYAKDYAVALSALARRRGP